MSSVSNKETKGQTVSSEILKELIFIMNTTQRISEELDKLVELTSENGRVSVAQRKAQQSLEIWTRLFKAAAEEEPIVE